MRLSARYTQHATRSHRGFRASCCATAHTFSPRAAVDEIALRLSSEQARAKLANQELSSISGYPGIARDMRRYDSSSIASGSTNSTGTELDTSDEPAATGSSASRSQ